MRLRVRGARADSVRTKHQRPLLSQRSMTFGGHVEVVQASVSVKMSITACPMAGQGWPDGGGVGVGNCIGVARTACLPANISDHACRIAVDSDPSSCGAFGTS